jgi:hypothetical protein
MSQRLRLDGVEYDLTRLSSAARQVVERLHFVQHRLHEIQNRRALLIRAKNAYIADLKDELLQPVCDPVVHRSSFSLRDDDVDTF